MPASPQIMVVVATLLLYLPALACPAVYVDEGGHGCQSAVRLGTLPGIAALLLGWLPPMTVPWAANPLLLVGGILLLCRQAKAATYVGLAAAGLGVTTWGCHWMLGWKGLEAGYYLWQASLVVFAAGAGAVWAWQASRRPTVLRAVLVDEAIAEEDVISPPA